MLILAFPRQHNPVIKLLSLYQITGLAFNCMKCLFSKYILWKIMQIFVASKSVEHVSDHKIILQPYHRGLFCRVNIRQGGNLSSLTCLCQILNKLWALYVSECETQCDMGGSSSWSPNSTYFHFGNLVVVVVVVVVAFQLQEYQTDVGRCKPRSRQCCRPHMAETSALVTETLV